MIRIAVYGIGENTKRFLTDLKTRNMGSIEILYFVQTQKITEYYAGKRVIEASELEFKKIDYLVITSDIYYDEIIDILKQLIVRYELFDEKIVRYRDFFSKLWEKARCIMPYQSCTIHQDIVYIAKNTDEVIPRSMFETGENYSEYLIHIFFDLVKKYYNRDVSKDRGVFLDIGANIGTTSIYVKKKINKNLKFVGFEPSIDNYGLFRVNCILNETEDIEIELLGLSNKNFSSNFLYNASNSGHSHIVGNELCDNVTTVELVKLDDYLKDNYILPEEIDYIWMDTEGHECEVLEGAIQTLSIKKIPLLQEFNPIEYSYYGKLERYCEIIKKIYDYFIDTNEYVKGDINIYPIKDIYNFALKKMENKIEQTDLFFF